MFSGFFVEPVQLYVGDNDTFSALRVGARHYGFKKTPQSYWPGKEPTHCGYDRIWERRDHSWHRNTLQGI